MFGPRPFSDFLRRHSAPSAVASTYRCDSSDAKRPRRATLDIALNMARLPDVEEVEVVPDGESAHGSFSTKIITFDVHFFDLVVFAAYVCGGKFPAAVFCLRGRGPGLATDPRSAPAGRRRLQQPASVGSRSEIARQSGPRGVFASVARSSPCVCRLANEAAVSGLLQTPSGLGRRRWLHQTQLCRN